MTRQKRRFPGGYNSRGRERVLGICSKCGTKESYTRPITHLQDGLCGQCRRDEHDRWLAENFGGDDDPTPKIANTAELEHELRQLLAYVQSEQPSRMKLAKQIRALSERVAEWNTAGAWYVTRGFPGELLYFRCTGQFQKNGKAMGVLVTLDTDRPRARPKAKRYSADRAWQRQFTPVLLSEVPPNVIAAAKPFEDPIPVTNVEPNVKPTRNVFPIGALVLVNGRYEARVKEVFPEGSTSFAHPHYVVDIVNGDRNVKVPMHQIGVSQYTESHGRWPKLR